MRAVFTGLKRAAESHDLQGFLAWFSSSYMHSGRNRNAVMQELQEGFAAVEQFAYRIDQVEGAAGVATVRGFVSVVFSGGEPPITWTEPDPSPEGLGLGYLREEGGSWRIVGNQQKASVTVATEHDIRSTGDAYLIRLSVASSVSITTVTAMGPSQAPIPLPRVPGADRFVAFDWAGTPLPVGTRYSFDILFGDGTRQTLEDTVKSWVPVGPSVTVATTATTATIHWTDVSASVPNAAYYWVWVEGDGVSWYSEDLPLTRSSVAFNEDGGATGALKPGGRYSVSVFLFDSFEDYSEVATSFTMDGGLGQAPTVTRQPQSQTLIAGASATLSVGASGTEPLRYQWYMGSPGDISLPVVGAVGAALTTPPVNTTTLFWARVSNAAGFADSDAAVLSIGMPPEITEQPRSQTIDAGSSAVLRVTVTGTSPFTYRWYAGSPGDTSQPISTSSVPTLTIPSPKASASYWVRVTSAFGSADSVAAVITVRYPLGQVLFGMGDRRNGRLGDGFLDYRSLPVRVASRVSAVSAGSYHSLFLGEDGKLWGTGDNRFGQLGLGTVPESVVLPVALASNITLATAGESHSLFVGSQGTLWATGNNSAGQLGDGTTIRRFTPVEVATGVVSVAAGSSHSLYITTDRTLWAMGGNSYGQLGDGSTINHPLPAAVATGVVAVEAAHGHTLFLKTDASLWGMGWNAHGELGDGTTTNHSTPILIATNVVSFAAGFLGTLFVKSDSSMWGMGANYSGELGDGTTTTRLRPVKVADSVVRVRARGTHALFQKADGSLWSMGDNTYGQLGDGSLLRRSDPVRVANGVLAHDAGGHHTLFVMDDAEHTLWAVGDNFYGQLGDGTTVDQAFPKPLVRGVTYAAAGRWHSLFIRTDKTLWGMGYNASSTLGYGSPAERVPKQVAPVATYAVAGFNHTVFLDSDRGFWGLGSNFTGELGDGTTTARPLPVRLGNNVVTASAGSAYTLFVRSDGTLWGTGDNSGGQLGDGTKTGRTSPVKVATDVVSVVAASRHSLFIKTNGTLWAMGYGFHGELGDGSRREQLTPISVASGVLSLAAGDSHSLFVREDGTLWAMGGNTYGQLGDGTLSDRFTPVQVATGVTKIAAGNNHSLFVTIDGALWAMGSNSHGQLGDGTTVHRSTPVRVARGVVAAAAGIDFSLFLGAEPTTVGLARRAAGGFDLTVKGTVEQRYRVETSVNLSSWASVTSVTLTNQDGTAVVHYPSQPSDPQRFFRVAPE